ncbi:hypothetical protein NPIL_461551 [Nephila pilipes]|uniref:CCHC-type domain-containing protein n=1 Tax=Nephila pilipes TaxID=299642 RepID=A0A8X6PEM0_NEPPI|nr:hypothetical protein NPIL_461551 [Nephila pilipes]
MSSDKYITPQKKKEKSRKEDNNFKRKDCYTCGGYQHLSRECPDKRKRNGRNFNKNPYSIKNNPINKEAIMTNVDSSYLQA